MADEAQPPHKKPPTPAPPPPPKRPHPGQPQKHGLERPPGTKKRGKGQG